MGWIKLGKKFKFTIDGKVYHANMIDNPLVEKIAKMCPFEADYQRYTEHEYYTRLPEKTSAKGCKMTTMAYKNQVFYFEGWNAFTILFGDCNIAPFEVVHLGDMVEDVVPQLKDAGATVHVNVEVEND